MKVTIASGKGGTGKTTLSTNLAMYMAQQQAVVLCDLDVEEPNSGLFIQGKQIHQQKKFKRIPQWNKAACILCGNCQEVCNFHAVLKLGERVMVFPELCHSCYACSELCPVNALPMQPIPMGELKHSAAGKLSFVDARLDIGQEQAVPLIAQTLDYVDSKFDSTFLKLYDAPPGTSCPVIEATKSADLVLLITEPTPFGLHDLKLTIDTMRELKKDFAVIINRYGIGNDDVLTYCAAEGIKVLAKLPNERKIAELYSRGELIYPQVPEFAKQLKLIADFIVSKQRHSA
ncbi:MAG: ATP-binding protein [Candidatus Cloacimonas sp.]|jgi:MinD superfamily P-loop ATPase|nr:ATP-binding protein [Candidatus Cloacimonas sp.]